MKIFNNGKSDLFYISQLAIDFLLLMLGFQITIKIAGVYLYPNMAVGLNDALNFVYIGAASAFFSILLFQLYGVLRCGRKSLIEIISSVLLALIIINLAILFFNCVTKTSCLNCLIVLTKFIIEALLIIIFKIVVYKLHPRFYKKRNVSIVGNDFEAALVSEKVLLKNSNMFHIDSIINEFDKNVEEKLKNAEVIFICPGVEANTKKIIIHNAIGRGKHIYIVPDFMRFP